MHTKIFKVFLCRRYANWMILIVKSNLFKYGVLYIIFWMKNITQKCSYTFLNTLIQANGLIIKVLTGSLIMLNIMSAKVSPIFPSFLWGPGRRSWYLFSFSLTVSYFSKLNQVKTMIKESYSERQSPTS